MYADDMAIIATGDEDLAIAEKLTTILVSASERLDSDILCLSLDGANVMYIDTIGRLNKRKTSWQV